MKPFMDSDFLLHSDPAKLLYHDHAAGMPIFDFHCHLNPKEIYEDRPFTDIADIWLGGDHYKWRAMRAWGVDEKYITGDAPPKEKFIKYAEAIQHAPGNALYHWSHLELARYFGITRPLTADSAGEIYEEANAVISRQAMSPRSVMRVSNVKAVFTTDDPADTLEYHRLMADDFDIKVLPVFRPDKALAVDQPGFLPYITRLALAADMDITDLPSLEMALRQRLDFFVSLGARASDHALAAPVFLRDRAAAERALAKALAGRIPDADENEAYKTELMLFLGWLYAERNMCMELHFAAIRNNNTAMFNRLGPDVGCDSIHDPQIAYKLSRYLDTLASDGALPKTMLFSLNPTHNAVLASMAGNFQSGQSACPVRGKVQFAAAWWFNDTKAGILEQMRTLAEMGVLGTFTGMLTDSRSFLSYPRHEYFRRILCGFLGDMVEGGEYPADMDTLGRIVRDICYHNAVKYMNMDI